MKQLIVVLTAAIWLVAVFLSEAQAQASKQQEGDSTLQQKKLTTLQSEEEIWEFLEKLCEEAPTQRCASMEFIRVRDGESIPMTSYSEREAYGARGELIEAALAIQAE